MEPPKDLTPLGDSGQILRTIEQIVLIQDPQERQKRTNAFIQQRVSRLTKQSVERDVAEGIIRDFIHPKTVLRPNAEYPGFNLDDPSAYTILFDTIREFKEDPDWQKKPIDSSYAVHITLLKYFGGVSKDTMPDYKTIYKYLSTIKQESRRHGIDFDSISIPINYFKNNRIGHCLERSAMAHNLFTFLGVESILILGGLQEPEPIGHAFILTRQGDEHFIFDPMNPIIYFNNQGARINSYPSNHRITLVEFQSILAKGKVDVIHNNYTIDNGKLKPMIPEKIVYSGQFPQ